MIQTDVIVKQIASITQNVFQTMIGLEVMPGQHVVDRNPPGPSSGIISVIGLAGTWIGTGSICCSGEFGCKISSQMLMVPYTEVNEDVLDAVSELTNMIIGNFKTAAESELGPLGLSIPTVIYGYSFCARSAGKEEWIIVPFTCEGEAFEVRVCLTPNRGFSYRAPQLANTVAG
jgi:chemotaxis protein CheX